MTNEQVLTTTTNEFQLTPAFVEDSWSTLIRSSSGSAASSIYQAIPLGTYIEVRDRKFGGDSLIIFRKTDFEKLVRSSCAASQIKKMLFSVQKTVLTYQPGTDPTALIEAVRHQADVAVELAGAAPLYASKVPIQSMST